MFATSNEAPVVVKSITMAEPSQMEVTESGRVLITAFPLTSSGAESLMAAVLLTAETVLKVQAIKKAENKAK